MTPFLRATHLSFAALVLAALSSSACSGTTIGTGGDGGAGAGSQTPAGSGGSSSPGVSGGSTTTDPGASLPSEYDSLFGAPSSTTVSANSIGGLWAGTMSNTSDDIRLVIKPSSITMAVRCNSGHGGVGQVTTIGMTVKAVVSATSIRLLESKTIGGPASCEIIVHPQTLPRCAASTVECFDVVDTTLHFDGYLFSGDGSLSRGPDPSFTKLSD
jgi:hypothetical protein